jgi:hypothetical protein
VVLIIGVGAYLFLARENTPIRRGAVTASR